MTARIIIGLLFIVLGISALTGLDLGRFIFPAILIFIGFVILSGRGNRGFQAQTSQSSSLNESWVFTGGKKIIQSNDFKGGKLAMVFGGGEIDLSRVKTSRKEVVMEISAVFGGLKLIVPKDWQVESEAAAFLGGVDNHTSGGGKKSVTLKLKGSAVFGGIEIAN